MNKENNEEKDIEIIKNSRKESIKSIDIKNVSCIDKIKLRWNFVKSNITRYVDYLKPYIKLSLEFTRIILGCLLFIFIPQLCAGPDENVISLENKYNLNISTIESKHICTLQDNFFNINDYKKFVITWNFLTLLIFLINFFWEIKREKYMQSHFEYTIQKKIEDVKPIFKSNKKLDRSFYFKTKVLYYLNYTCLFMVLTNILFTSYMIYYYYYDGFRSVTGLISSVLLILQKLYYNYDVLNMSLKRKYILSTSLVKPYDYNTLEPIKFKQSEYIKKENYKKSYRVYYLDDSIKGIDNFIIQTINGFTPITIYDNNISKDELKSIRNIIKTQIKTIKLNVNHYMKSDDLDDSGDDSDIRSHILQINENIRNSNTRLNMICSDNNENLQISSYDSLPLKKSYISYSDNNGEIDKIIEHYLYNDISLEEVIPKEYIQDVLNKQKILNESIRNQSLIDTNHTQPDFIDELKHCNFNKEIIFDHYKNKKEKKESKSEINTETYV